MRLIGNRAAPAVKARVKEGVRHEAMSFCLAGIVATLVLNTFKVSLPLPSSPLSLVNLFSLFSLLSLYIKCALLHLLSLPGRHCGHPGAQHLQGQPYARIRFLFLVLKLR